MFEQNSIDNKVDLVGCSPHKSGKTLASLISSVSLLLNNNKSLSKLPSIEVNSHQKTFVSYPLIILIFPKSELLIQAYNECLKLL